MFVIIKKGEIDGTWDVTTIVPKCFDDYKHSKVVLIFALEVFLKGIGTRQGTRKRIQGNGNYSSKRQDPVKS